MREQTPRIEKLLDMKTAAEHALALADECDEAMIGVRLHESVLSIDARLAALQK